MVVRNAVETDYLSNDVAEGFCRLSLTVEVESNQVLVFGICAKWFLIDWGEAGWTESTRHKYREAGYYNVNIVGESIGRLDLDGCGITFIDFDRCDFLTRLRCRNNKLRGLSLERCPSLSFVDCSRNRLEYVQLSNLKKLKEFKGCENRLQMVDFSGCRELKGVDLCYNEVEMVVVRDCRKLKYVLFGGVMFEMRVYKRVAKGFPGIIICEKGFLNVVGEEGWSGENDYLCPK